MRSGPVCGQPPSPRSPTLRMTRSCCRWRPCCTTSAWRLPSTAIGCRSNRPADMSRSSSPRAPAGPRHGPTDWHWRSSSTWPTTSTASSPKATCCSEPPAWTSVDATSRDTHRPGRRGGCHRATPQPGGGVRGPFRGPSQAQEELTRGGCDSLRSAHTDGGQPTRASRISPRVGPGHRLSPWPGWCRGRRSGRSGRSTARAGARAAPAPPRSERVGTSAAGPTPPGRAGGRLRRAGRCPPATA